MSARRSAYTVLEVMLIVAIVAMMIAILVPGMWQSRRRARAQAVRHEMKLLDEALHQYAMQTGKPPGKTATFDDLKKYIDPRSELAKDGGRDLLGHSFGVFTVGAPIHVPRETAAELDSVVDPAFWADYK